ncbi:MAG: hypothetical protein JNK31_03220 [Candidatus Competibacter sp.]|nr:hypothetical protein [Candidatus Competibacter sp.]
MSEIGLVFEYSRFEISPFEGLAAALKALRSRHYLKKKSRISGSHDPFDTGLSTRIARLGGETGEICYLYESLIPKSIFGHPDFERAWPASKTKRKG